MPGTPSAEIRGVFCKRLRREGGTEGGREGWDVHTIPGHSSPAHGAWRVAGPPTPPRPSRLGLAPPALVLAHLPEPRTPSPEPPAPAVSGEGERAEGPERPSKLIASLLLRLPPQLHSVPRARKARARPGHSRSGYIRSRGGGPLPGLKGGARGAPRLTCCTAPATRWVPRAAPAADGWRCSAPCPARLYPHPPTPPVSGTHRMESAELAFPSSLCTPCPLVPLTSL